MKLPPIEKIIYRFFILCLFTGLYGQSYSQVNARSELTDLDDYSQWLSESLSKIRTQLNLTQLSEVQEGLQYRIWLEGQVIDINRDSENNYEGLLTNFANTASYLQNDDVKSYSTNEKINNQQLEQLFALLSEYEKIDYKNVWQNAEWEIDKVKLLFIIESSVNGNYSIQEVWIPKQDSDIKEVNQYKLIADSFIELLDLNEKFESFFGNLSNACYVTSVHTFRCKSDERSEMANRWLLSKQPVDSMLVYLNEQDWGYIAANNDWILYTEIIVSFNKKGKIKKVKFEIQNGIIHIDDLNSKNIRRLKKQVKETLINLDFSLFEPPESYIVEIFLTYNISENELVWGNG